jgi:hypothetical protein
MYNSIIDQLQKDYEQTPVVDQAARTRIQSEMKEAERDLKKLRAEYKIFKQDQTKTAISK